MSTQAAIFDNDFIDARTLRRGGVKTIPACNAAWSGLLHIIDFRHASFILRLVFAVCTTGNSKQCLETLSFR